METAIIEAAQSLEHGPNWGKFLLMRPDTEWGRISHVDTSRSVPVLGLHRDRREIWVMDLATGEGACFTPGPHMASQLEAHGIRVCLLYEPLLAWLATRDLTDLSALPPSVEPPDAAAGLWGYRRSGAGRRLGDPGPPFPED